MQPNLRISTQCLAHRMIATTAAVVNAPTAVFAATATTIAMTATNQDPDASTKETVIIG